MFYFGRKKTTIVFEVGIAVEPDEEGFYAYCPSLEGLHCWGKTQPEAIERAKEAAIAYIESLIKHKDPIPLNAKILREENEPLPSPQMTMTTETFSFPACV